MPVLALEPVRVIGIHAAQQLRQARLCRRLQPALQRKRARSNIPGRAGRPAFFASTSRGISGSNWSERGYICEIYFVFF